MKHPRTYTWFLDRHATMFHHPGQDIRVFAENINDEPTARWVVKETMPDGGQSLITLPFTREALERLFVEHRYPTSGWTHDFTGDEQAIGRWRIPSENDPGFAEREARNAEIARRRAIVEADVEQWEDGE